VDDRQLPPIPQRLERLQLGVEAEEAVEIDRRGVAAVGAGNGDIRPRWKMAISCLERPEAATAVRAMKDGAKPRLTKANAPFFRKTRRETIEPPV